MGMNLGAGSGRGGVQGDINITPLIDVVLVLLIIFMVLVPATVEQLTAVVPERLDSPERRPPVDPPLVLAVGAGGKLALNGAGIEPRDLPGAIRERLAHKRDKVVFFEVDDGARYGEAVRLMDLVTGAGATTLAIVTKE